MKKLKPTIVLSAICLTVALLLAVVNMVTLPIIEKANEEKLQAEMKKVMPDGVNFTEISLDGLAEEVTRAFSEDGGGYVFQLEVTGYKPGLVIVCGIDESGKITGAEYISSSETLEAEIGLGSRFIGHTTDSITLDIVAGSTAKLTTNAYYKAIEIALSSFDKLQNK